MSKKDVAAKLAQVKLELAEKCERLIKTVKSKPRQAKLRHQAARFRRQAADLTRR
jgi:hypothetical protein